MNDIFIEQIVRKKKSSKDTLRAIGGFVAAGIVTLISVSIIPGLFPLVLLGTAFLAYFNSIFCNIEYEYQFTNTELDIDAIYNKQRRKKKISLNLKDSVIIYNSSNQSSANQYSKVKAIDYSSGNEGITTYNIITNINGVQTKLIIEPNENLVNAMEQKLGRRIFVKY